MKLILISIYIIDFILIFFTIRNLIKANNYFDKESESFKNLIEIEEANFKLELQIYEYEKILKEINLITSEKGQGSIVDRFDKIKEVIQPASKNNF